MNVSMSSAMFGMSSMRQMQAPPSGSAQAGNTSSEASTRAEARDGQIDASKANGELGGKAEARPPPPPPPPDGSGRPGELGASDASSEALFLSLFEELEDTETSNAASDASTLYSTVQTLLGEVS